MPGLSSEVNEHEWSSCVGSIVGSQLENGCSAGQKPGQPRGLSLLMSARRVALLARARCSRKSWVNATAAPPVAPAGFSTGPNNSDVPAPDSKATLFIGCFEYSYDSMAVENP